MWLLTTVPDGSRWLTPRSLARTLGATFGSDLVNQGLIYGFSYTKDTTVVKLGPLEVTAKEQQVVNVPLWLGIGAIAVGGLLLVFGSKER